MARSVKSVRAQTYDNLSVMLAAGVPMHRAIQATADGTRGPMRKAMTALVEAVGRGERLSDEMAIHGRAFSEMDVMFVRAGETSGHLDRCLKTLGEWHKFSDHLRRLLTSGMVFPLAMYHMAAGLVPLPPLFLGVIDFEEYLWQVAAWLGAMYGLIALVVLIVRCTPARGPARALLDWLVLRVPLLGAAMRQLAMSRYLRAFNMLYGAAVPVAIAADSAADVMGNLSVRKLVVGAGDAARAGEPVSAGFSRRLPAAFIATWQNGEEAGSLDIATDRLAIAAATDAEFHLAQFVKWMPKIMYALVCVRIVIAILQNASVLAGHLNSIV